MVALVQTGYHLEHHMLAAAVVVLQGQILLQLAVLVAEEMVIQTVLLELQEL
jgi:hypothetical protein